MQIPSDNPLVSITVLTYNSEKYVVETLESIKNQTYENIELIISDDRSGDNTIDKVEQWIAENKSRFATIHFVKSNINTGIPKNKNRALKKCHGKWIKFIAGDDALNSDCIKVFMEHAKAHPEALLLHANAQSYLGWFDESKLIDKTNLSKIRFNQDNITVKDQLQILLRYNPIYAGTVIFNRNIFEVYGLYDENLRFWDDGPMWLRLSKNGVKFYFLDKYVLKYRVHEQSVSKTKGKDTLFSPFLLERSNYILKNHANMLPLWEKILAKIFYYRFTVFHFLGINKKKKLYQVLWRVSGNIPNYYLRKIKTKYI